MKICGVDASNLSGVRPFMLSDMLILVGNVIYQQPHTKNDEANILVGLVASLFLFPPFPPLPLFVGSGDICRLASSSLGKGWFAAQQFRRETPAHTVYFRTKRCFHLRGKESGLFCGNIVHGGCHKCSGIFLIRT